MTDYYVSMAGKDGNSGRTPQAPWRGVQKGINALAAGDTLHIMAGTYYPGDEGADFWLVKNKNGTARKEITIKNYDGGKVNLTGRESGVGSGRPQRGLAEDSSAYTYKGTTYKSTVQALFYVVDSSYLTVDGLQVTDSLGHGVNLHGTTLNDFDSEYKGSPNEGRAPAHLHHVTVKNCKIHNTRMRNMFVRWAWDVTLENNEFSFGNWANGNGSGGPTLQQCYYIFFDNNVFHHLEGEAIVADSNNYHSRNIYIRNNVFYDVSRSPIYVHGADYVIIAGNLIYRTPETNKYKFGVCSDNPTCGGLNANYYGIIINARECYNPLNDGCAYILISHNIIQNHPGGIWVGTERDDPNRCREGYQRAPMEYIYVTNNTVVGGDYTWPAGSNYHWWSDTFKNCVFKNNISVHADGKKHLTGEGNPTGISSDYNLFDSSHSAPSRLTGPNDIVNENPKLMNPEPIDTARAKKQEDAAGWWFSTLTSGYDNATGFRIRSSSPCKNSGTTVTAPRGWKSDSYNTSMADYLDWSYNFSNTGANEIRGGYWDIGADEYRIQQSIQANFSASPTGGTTPVTVSFKDKSSSTSPVTSRFWDFGDGIISTEKDPVHQYNQGTYTVSLRVTSNAGTDIETKTNLISVTAPIESDHKRVTEGLRVLYRFNEGAGDTIYDVSGADLPLDLKISNTNAVSWLSQGLNITKSTVIVSNGPASKINAACRETNEITMEIWLKPRNRSQDGPARIITVSKNMHSRNITLGQGLWGTQPSNLYDLRLRTTERSANGMPSFSSPEGTVKRKKTHLVFTRKRNGRVRYYIDGVIVAETNIPGDFSTWNPRFPLLLGNETTGEYPWRGEIYLVAVYERALKLSEVKQNFKAGTGVAPLMQEISAPLTSSFRRFVMVKNGVESAISNGATKAIAYGVEYPDKRCVLCANGKVNSMAVYPDVNTIIRTYGKQNLKIHWLD